jgi:hypothetical protein
VDVKGKYKRAWSGFIWLRTESSEYNNEPSSSIRAGNAFTFLKKISAP